MSQLTHGPRITVAFPGGKRVTAGFAQHRVTTDQPAAAGGDDSAPAPFDLFFASLATCAGYYVLEFCRARDIPLDGVVLTQSYDRDATTRRVVAIRQEIAVPAAFPDKYRKALLAAASSCSVKKLLDAPPAIEVQVTDA